MTTPAKIYVENFTRRRDFYDLRSELIEQQKKFDETTLCFVPYDQLQLCCIGNAGLAACSPRLVQIEKRFRRQRFLAMEPTDLKKCERLLRREHMYEDVMNAVASLGAARWEHLSERQQTWAKLNCITNHIEHPKMRLGEAILLLRKCASSSLPSDVCSHYITKLKGLMTIYPGRVTDDFFREAVADVRDNILRFMPEEERAVCVKEQIIDFQCTSDCFRLLI
jgi:hypothetical protein